MISSLCFGNINWWGAWQIWKMYIYWKDPYSLWDYISKLFRPPSEIYWQSLICAAWLLLSFCWYRLPCSSNSIFASKTSWQVKICFCFYLPNYSVEKVKCLVLVFSQNTLIEFNARYWHFLNLGCSFHLPDVLCINCTMIVHCVWHSYVETLTLRCQLVEMSSFNCEAGKLEDCIAARVNKIPSS